MPADEGASFLLYAKSQEEEALLFQRWLPYQTVVSFAEFKESLKPITVKDDAVVLADVEAILTSMEVFNGNI